MSAATLSSSSSSTASSSSWPGRPLLSRRASLVPRLREYILAVVEPSLSTTLPSSPGEEAEQVAAAWTTRMDENDEWSIVDDKWWQQWLQYSGFNPTSGTASEGHTHNSSDKGIRRRPGPIDNQRLCDHDQPGSLNKALQESRDYVLLHSIVAKLLYDIYGGGPKLNRSVVVVGLTRKPQLELYPAFLSLFPTLPDGEPDKNAATLISFSARSTFTALKRYVKVAHNKQVELNKSDIHKDDEHDFTGSSSSSTSSSSSSSSSSSPDGLVDVEDESNVRIWLELDATDDDSSSSSSSSSSSDSASASSYNFRLIDGDQLKAPLDTFNLIHGAAVLIEFRNADGSWKRATGAERDFYDFQVGDVIDAEDKWRVWNESVVRYVTKDAIEVHFNGQKTEHDERIPRVDRHRFAPRGTKSSSRSSYSSSSSTSLVNYYGSSSSSFGSSYYGYGGWSTSSSGRPIVPGAVGLNNLGNTCFMNSVLSCLAHTPILTHYFITDSYIRDINRNNPLGWQGKIADEFGRWIKEYWSGQYTTVSPRRLKEAIGEFQPRFSGWNQQDSHELLSFVVDGLHEDLNRVLTKPATQAVESNDRPDEVVAKEAWQTHVKRNQSIVVDTFQGQLKSRVVCPETNCKKVSITFDTFTYLAVPLPIQNDVYINVHFVSSEVGVPITLYSCHVSKLGRMTDLKQALSTLTGVPVRRIVVSDMWNNRIYRFYEDDHSLNDIRATDITYAFDVPSIEDNEKNPWVPIQIVHQKVLPDDGHYHSRYSDPRIINVGTPLVVALPLGKRMSVGEAKLIIHSAIVKTIKQAPPPPPHDDTAPPPPPPTDPASSSSSSSMTTETTSSSSGASASPEEDAVIVNKSDVDAGEDAVIVDAPGGVNTTATASADDLTGSGKDEEGASSASSSSSSSQSNNTNASNTTSTSGNKETDDDNKPTFNFVQLDTDLKSCAQCSYMSHCLGCPLGKSDDDSFDFKVSSRGYYSLDDNQPKEAKIAFGIQWLKLDSFDEEASTRVVKHSSVAANAGADGDECGKPVTLQECIRLFSREETLSPNDAWFCPTCREHRCASKKMDLWNLPPLLLIHLKRFQFTRYWREKISTLVDFPVSGLDLSEFTQNPIYHDGEHGVYDLYAVSNHYGGMGGGHYTAYIKNLATQQWYCHDDSRVSRVTEDEIKSSAAYVLFYRRRDVKVDKEHDESASSSNSSTSSSAAIPATQDPHQD